MPEVAATTEGRIDWKEVSDKLQNLLRLRTLPVGMKLFKTVDEGVWFKDKENAAARP